MDHSWIHDNLTPITEEEANKLLAASMKKYADLIKKAQKRPPTKAVFPDMGEVKVYMLDEGE